MTRAQQEYESMVGGVLSHVWRREGEHIVCDPAETKTPLVEVLAKEDAVEPCADLAYLPPDLKELQFMARLKLVGVIEKLVYDRHEKRRETLDTFLNYLFAEGPDMLKVLERLFIYTRASHRGHVWNMSLTEMARMFGHTKQNWQHREQKLMEELVTRWSRSEFVSSGGKSKAARVAYAVAQAGNTHRRDGRKTGDDLPPLPPADAVDKPLTGRAKVRAELMRQDAERKRLAGMCDCDPDEIDLSRISMSDAF